MKKGSNKVMENDLRSEYDLSALAGGVRGKYAERYKAGTNLVHLESDVAEVFRDDVSVNRALRSLMDIAKTQVVGGK